MNYPAFFYYSFQKLSKFHFMKKTSKQQQEQQKKQKKKKEAYCGKFPFFTLFPTYFKQRKQR